MSCKELTKYTDIHKYIESRRTKRKGGPSQTSRKKHRNNIKIVFVKLLVSRKDWFIT